MPADWTLKQGDSHPSLVDTLTLSDGTVPNYRGATVALEMRSLSSGSVVPLTGTAQFTNPNSGAVQFVPTTEDTSVPGNYMMSWRVTFADGSPMTFPTTGYLWAKIEPSLVDAPAAIVDLPTVREHIGLRDDDRSRDSRLLRYIDYVTPLIEERTGPIVPRVFDEWHDGGSMQIELLRRPSSGFGTSPTITLVACSEYWGAVEYPLAIVPSPTYGSIYSVFLNQDQGTITRRSAGGSTLAFIPGLQTVHVVYQAGQSRTPPNVEMAALEAVRCAYEWTRQTGTGSRSMADGMEVGSALQYELSRVIRSFLGPTRRAPAFA